jgi:succinyldiaminopimelate transaminase
LRRSVSAGLPDFPWDTLEPAKARAAEHPDGLVDLSIGTPVDPVPPVIRQALAAAADSPGYPLTIGTPVLRSAMAAYISSVTGASGAFGVAPSIGSKELIAWLPTLLGLGPSDTVVIPSVCYPTYEVGARLAGARVVRSDTPPAAGASLVWLNSPGNPSGRVMPASDVRAWVDWARSCGAILASDECYLSLPWEETPVSVLDPSVSGGSLDGLLAVHSLSKRSNLAGYRAGLFAGDPALVDEIVSVRKHSGMMVPGPVQAAMVAALSDTEHVDAQRAVYAARRVILREAVEKAGYTVHHSAAGLYLWITRGEHCSETLDWFASRGILVAPGSFYGPDGELFVRLALTATDERIAAAAARLTA